MITLKCCIFIQFIAHMVLRILIPRLNKKCLNCSDILIYYIRFSSFDEVIMKNFIALVRRNDYKIHFETH